MVRSCRLAIAYDSEGLPGYETGWGFSLLVTLADRNILFDCGWDGQVLKRNLARMDVSFSDIDAIVLSHQHWDHISGLPTLLSERLTPERPHVFLLSSFSEKLKAEISRKATVTEVEGPMEIMSGVWSTGELGSGVKEQSLILLRGGECVVATGCAHPGIAPIMEHAMEHGRPSVLIGGFHGAAAADIPSGMKRVVACHCTRDKSSILESFGDAASIGRAGDIFRPWDDG